MSLRKAILNHDLNTVKRLLAEDPVSIDESADGIWLPFLAAQTGDEEIVRYIVEYSRASFNETDDYNRDILYYGVESGNLSLVRYLVEKVGMNPVKGDTMLQTPYDLAHSLGYTEIEAYFSKVCGAGLSDMYRNPILTGMHPDPSIVCVGDDFYMFNSSFIFFPCIPISHSRDLIHWKTIGHAITNPEWAALDGLEGGRGYWAPDISYYEGRFYITATYRLNDTGTIYRKQMVTSSDQPEGPYCEPAFLDEDGIDPSIFTDVDGKRYMILNRGARAFEISSDGKKQLSEAKLLYYGHQKRAPEGSHLLLKDGWYYLFQAEGGTGEGHRISVSRSKELFGTYTPCPFNPIMRQQDEKAALQRCGHGKPVKTPNGEWYMVYLCARKYDNKYSFLGRETALDPITWTLDGWPMVNGLQGPSVLQRKPNLPEFIHKQEDENDSFLKHKLSLDWISPRPPVPGAFTFCDGRLRMRGSRADLSSMHARNILVRRQEYFNFTATCSLVIPVLEQGQSLGMTCYYDENTYLLYGIRKENDRLTLFVVEHIGDDTRTVFCKRIDEEVSQQYRMGVQTEISLMIETKGLERAFSSSVMNDKWSRFGTLDQVNYLCDEGLKRGKRFTGAMIGMYVFEGEAKEELFGEFIKFNVKRM